MWDWNVILCNVMFKCCRQITMTRDEKWPYHYHIDLLRNFVFHSALSPQTALDTLYWQPSSWPSFASYEVGFFKLLPIPRWSCLLLHHCYVTSLCEGVLHSQFFFNFEIFLLYFQRQFGCNTIFVHSTIIPLGLLPPHSTIISFILHQ